jgi:hypothetical protein
MAEGGAPNSVFLQIVDNLPILQDYCPHWQQNGQKKCVLSIIP